MLPDLADVQRAAAQHEPAEAVFADPRHSRIAGAGGAGQDPLVAGPAVRDVLLAAAGQPGPLRVGVGQVAAVVGVGVDRPPGQVLADLRAKRSGRGVEPAQQAPGRQLQPRAVAHPVAQQHRPGQLAGAPAEPGLGQRADDVAQRDDVVSRGVRGVPPAVRVEAPRHPVRQIQRQPRVGQPVQTSAPAAATREREPHRQRRVDHLGRHLSTRPAVEPVVELRGELGADLVDDCGVVGQTGVGCGGGVGVAVDPGDVQA
jgi:hypothetical protein